MVFAALSNALSSAISAATPIGVQFLQGELQSRLLKQQQRAARNLVVPTIARQVERTGTAIRNQGIVRGLAGRALETINPFVPGSTQVEALELGFQQTFGRGNPTPGPTLGPPLPRSFRRRRRRRRINPLNIKALKRAVKRQDAFMDCVKKVATIKNDPKVRIKRTRRKKRC
jgi:hypothetical protein